MNIESNINQLALLMRNCLNVEIESDNNIDYYFAYKSVDGFAIGYFYTQQEAFLVDEYIGNEHEGVTYFNINDDDSGGSIVIQRDKVNTNLIIPFYIKPEDEVIRYTRRINKKENN